MNGNKSSCLQLTTAQTRIAKGIRLRKGGWMCLAGVPDNAPGRWSTWWVLGVNKNKKTLHRDTCKILLVYLSLKKESQY